MWQMNTEQKIGYGAAAVIVILGGYHFANQQNMDKAATVQPTSTPEKLLDSSRTLRGPIDINKVREQLSSIFGYASYGRQPLDRSSNLTNNRLRAMTTLMQNLYQDSPVKFANGEREVKIQNGYFGVDQVYKVDDPNDGIYANAIVEAVLKYFFLDKDRGFKYTSSTAIEDILALQGRLKFINQDPVQFRSPEGLMQFSRTLQTMETAGKRVPNKALITYDANAPVDQDTIIIGYGSIGRSLAEFYAKDPTLLSNYKKFLEGSGMEGVAKTRLEILLRECFEDGTRLRNWLLYQQITGAKSHYINFEKAEYDLVRDWLGVDISRDGMRAEVRSFVPGDMAGISDPDQQIDNKDYGILLRPTPEPGLDPSWPYVADKWAVRVLEGPTTTLFHDYDEATPMYKVEAGKVESLGDKKVWIPFVPPQKGWIKEDYMETFDPAKHRLGYNYWAPWDK